MCACGTDRSGTPRANETDPFEVWLAHPNRVQVAALLDHDLTEAFGSIAPTDAYRRIRLAAAVAIDTQSLRQDVAHDDASWGATHLATTLDDELDEVLTQAEP